MNGIGSTIGRLAALFTGGAVLGLLGNAVHPAGVPLARRVLAQADTGQCTAPGGPKDGAGPPQGLAAPVAVPLSIGPLDAQKLKGRPGVVIGDLRPPKDYAGGHIAGAIHLPCTGSIGSQALGRIPVGARLLLYDQDGRSPELQTAAGTALLRGIGEVYTLSGGFSAWLAAGLPAESGTCESCGDH